MFIFGVNILSTACARPLWTVFLIFLRFLLCYLKCIKLFSCLLDLTSNVIEMFRWWSIWISLYYYLFSLRCFSFFFFLYVGIFYYSLIPVICNLSLSEVCRMWYWTEYFFVFSCSCGFLISLISIMYLFPYISYFLIDVWILITASCNFLCFSFLLSEWFVRIW